MIKGKTLLKNTLIADALIFLLCIIGIYHIAEKAAFPFQFEDIDNKLFVTEVDDGIATIVKSDRIISVHNIKVENPEEIECVLDGIFIGDKVNVMLERSSLQIEVMISTIPFYSKLYLVIAAIACILFFVIGIFVLVKKPKLKSARFFHAGVISTAVIISTTWGNYNIEPYGMGYLLRICFSMAYSFAPIFFIDFVFSLRIRKQKNYKFIRAILYLITLVVLFLQVNSFLGIMQSITINSIKAYLATFNIFRVYLLIYITIGLILLVYTYISTREDYERKRLRWILFGFTVSLVGFLLLWIVPYIITSKGIIPEELLLLILMSIPITFAIAIVRYRILNIDLIIERSIVYFLAVVLLMIIYSTIIIVTQRIMNFSDNTFATIMTAILVVLFFQPVNEKLQSFVNKKFFRIRYNFREALTSIIDDIKDEGDINVIAKKVISKIEVIIPSEVIGFYLYDEKIKKLFLLADDQIIHEKQNTIHLEENRFLESLENPYAIPGSYEPGACVSEIIDTSFIGDNFSILFFLRNNAESLLGLIALGKKKSRTKFTLEDIDLLKTIASRIGNKLERIQLQEELIIKRIETERLKELNELKSLYVSTVSHDLKTPLTSIKMFAEILKENKNINEKKYHDYLQIIEGESDRLTRHINNVLDYAKIEKGIKEYQFEIIDLNKVVIEVLNLMDYQFKIKKFDVETDLNEKEVIVFGDGDAIKNAVINLLTNAGKYSDEGKKILVSTEVSEGKINLKVKDYGLGISDSDIENILNPYYRSDEKSIQETVGTGLGLAIIKHTMQAHSGNIYVQSELGKGSIFTLEFPIGDRDEKDIVN